MICGVIVSIDEEDFREFSLDHFSNVVVADINVLRSFFGDWITGDENRALVIPTDRDGFEVVAELPQKGMHPDCLRLQSESAIYSASVLDSAMVFCALDVQLITLGE